MGNHNHHYHHSDAHIKQEYITVRVGVSDA